MAIPTTGRVVLVSYLVAERAQWYRAIMHIFLQHHRDQYHYQLTLDDVLEAMRTTVDPLYTREKCDSDLGALRDWGNMITIFDPRHVQTIAAFRSPRLLYQAAPEAIALETFLDAQIGSNSSRGSLRQGDLQRLWESIQRIDQGIDLHRDAITDEQCRELAEEWQLAFVIWSTMAREVAQYLAHMISASQKSRAELESYLAYKETVINYVQSFAAALSRQSSSFRTLFAQWIANGKQEAVIAAIAPYLDPPTLDIQRTLEEQRAIAHTQIIAMMNWFAPRMNADTFRRNALGEIDNLLRKATALAANSRVGMNYAVMLHRLGRDIFAAHDSDTARRQFAAAFANVLPTHLPESFAGATREIEQDNPWQQPPVVTMRLRPVSRSIRLDNRAEDPIPDIREQARALVTAQQRRDSEQREKLGQLFAEPCVTIGASGISTYEQRSLLLDIIDACLIDPQHHYLAPDGSLITMINPDERRYGFLRSNDGVLVMPLYRLERQERLSGEERV